ncbi:MAG: potassium transporter TrkG [Mucinivorans sp.]
MRKKVRKWWLRIDLEQIFTFGIKTNVAQRQVALGYLSYILIGTALLCLPFATQNGTGFMDNLFSATSAISTTGLSTVVTADGYTLFGQIIILLLVQIGGLGYMTMSSFVMYNMTRHFMRIKNGVMRAEFSMPEGIKVHTMVQSIVYFTFIFEVLGAVVLYFIFSHAGAPAPAWAAVFHSVSAFCTAGFSTFSNGLENFSDNWGITIVISTLSYAGAMGFIVMHDLWNKIRKGRNHQITFTTKVIMTITILISVLGIAQLMCLEPMIQDMPLSEKFQVSLFQTMSAMTTVGFNTVPLSGFMAASLMVLVFVMYIGASPSGTGGGLKSTTASAVYAYVRSKLSGERDVTLNGHRLPTFRVDSALTTFAFYTSILFFGFYLLTITEVDITTDKLLFEAASALGTVGLTAGVTSSLSTIGQLIVIILMYIGRIGVITFGVAMLTRMAKKGPNEINAPKDNDIAI